MKERTTMPKYDVMILRTLTISTTVTVRAKTEEEAEKKALEQVNTSTLSWQIDDKNNWDEESDEWIADQIEED
jgi:hypothetical protein